MSMRKCAVFCTGGLCAGMEKISAAMGEVNLNGMAGPDSAPAAGVRFFILNGC
jgi:hypothetical protein